MIAQIVYGFLLVGWGALIITLSLLHLVRWFVDLLDYLDRGGALKFECSWLYLSYDQEGLLFELGNIDKPTAMFSIFYMTKGAFNDLETY